MSVVKIRGVGVFERQAIPAPGGGSEVVVYKSLLLDLRAPRSMWMMMSIAIVPSFATGLLIGINAAVWP